MLSDDLEQLALRFREYEHDGVTLSPAAVCGIAAALASAVQRAGALERLTVPHAGRLDPSATGANVLPFVPQEKPPSKRGAPRRPEPAA